MAFSRNAEKNRRPNRLGATICKVLRVEGKTLYVSELDAIDGTTPVLDIKPVMQEFLAARRHSATQLVARVDAKLLAKKKRNTLQSSQMKTAFPRQKGGIRSCYAAALAQATELHKRLFQRIHFPPLLFIRTGNPQLLNLARNGIAANTQTNGGIVFPAMRMFQRSLDHRRFKLFAQDIHHFTLPVAPANCAACAFRSDTPI